jgi:hypothetical protein
MVTFHSRKEQDADFRKELARLSSLVADMEAIGNGAAPEDLVEGEPPLLDRWVLGHRFIPCLFGASTGHPLLPGDNRVIGTSDLWLLSDDRDWARTLSRWYRLGRPGLSGFHS